METPDKHHLIIYYFSGTGNAQNVAGWCAEYAKKNGWNAEVKNIAETDRYTIPEPPPGSMIGFCSPTHGFNLPPIVLRFIRHFPRGNKNRVWIVNTRAGFKIWKLFLPGLTGIGQMWAVFLLRIKNYRITGMRPVDLPSNWISLHPGCRKKVVESITWRCYYQSVRFINKMIIGKKDYRALFDIVQDLLVSPVAIAYYFIGRFFLSKTYIASKECNGCGLCIKNCPVGAIKELDKRPYWTLKCESCMKCLNNCPRRAIETPHGFITVVLYLIFTVGMESLYFLATALIKNGTILSILNNSLIRFLIGSALAIPFLLLSYHVVHLLMRYPFFERLVTLTSLTHFRFWRRYKAVQDIPGQSSDIAPV